MYQQGMSMKEIASSADRSYTYVRNGLISSETKLRTKGQGTREYIKSHPEWSEQFKKYSIGTIEGCSQERIRLLTMIITEGYFNRHSIGFTNTQPELQRQFSTLVSSVYGRIHIGTNKITTRLWSIDVADDIQKGIPGKAFSPSLLRSIIASEELSKQVLRVVADTEGSMIVSVKRAPRNYTVECRVVLASTNRVFSRQLVMMLSRIGIDSHIAKVGVQVTAKDHIMRFIELVGFPRGVKVIRKKAGLSSWYGKEKRILSQLCLDIYSRQAKARASGRRGCFEECRTKSDTMAYLTGWYEAISGGERVDW